MRGKIIPYLAEVVKNLTTDTKTGEVNTGANLMAHATVNAALALASNNNALAGAAGATLGEAMGMIALNYYGKNVDELSEQQKQTVSTLATLAAGLAGGIAGNSTADAVTGAQAGKTTVENNMMGGTEVGQEKFVREHGKNMASCADNPTSASCQKGLAMQDALMVALPAGLGGGVLAAASPEIAAAAKAAIQACAGNVVLCLNNAGIQLSEAIVPGGVGAGGAIGIGKTATEAAAAKAEAIAAKAVKNAAGKGTVGNSLEWNSWQNYQKTTIDGKQYAQVGDRLYSQHAVDRMQPSGLGSPAGTVGAGRSISPGNVEHTIQNGTKTSSIVNGVERTVHWSGDVGVVTESNGKVIVTILRRSEK